MHPACACRAQRTASGLFFRCHLPVLFQFVWRQGLLLAWGLLIWLSRVASNSKLQGFPLTLDHKVKPHACLSEGSGDRSSPHVYAVSSILTRPSPNLFYASAPNWSPTVKSPAVMNRSRSCRALAPIQHCGAHFLSEPLNYLLYIQHSSLNKIFRHLI